MTLMKAVGVAEQNKLFIGHTWLPLFFHFTKSNKKHLNHTFTFILNTSKQIYRDNTKCTPTGSVVHTHGFCSATHGCHVWNLLCCV
jgi:hypothetical protein